MPLLVVKVKHFTNCEACGEGCGEKNLHWFISIIQVVRRQETVKSKELDLWRLGLQPEVVRGCNEEERNVIQSIITDLLSILHATHSARGSTLHPDRVSLGARRSIALAWIRTSLLGYRPCGRRLLLLGVRVGSSVWLATHLPYLVHWAWRLTETHTESQCITELRQWMYGLHWDVQAKLASKMCGKNMTLEMMVGHSVVDFWLMVGCVCLSLH